MRVFQVHSGLLFIITCVISTLLVALVRWYVTGKQMVDHPGSRRLHDQPTPRGGGVAVVSIILVTACYMPLGAFMQSGITIAVTGITLLGWLDDKSPLSALPKLCGMFLASGAALYCSAISLVLPMVLVLVALVALVWWVNVFNFMDGSNGLAASQAVLSLLVLTYIHANLFDPHLNSTGFVLLCAAAVCGFLPWNVPRARIFLGDSGSLGIAMTIGVISLATLSIDPTLWPLLLINVLVFMMDATATLFYRLFTGQIIMQAHTQHAYQRLVHMGWSHWHVCLAYSVVNVLFIWPIIWLGLEHPATIPYSLPFSIVLLAGLWVLIQHKYRIAGSNEVCKNAAG